MNISGEVVVVLSEMIGRVFTLLKRMLFLVAGKVVKPIFDVGKRESDYYVCMLVGVSCYRLIVEYQVKLVYLSINIECDLTGRE
jgi:hypothetical protein